MKNSHGKTTDIVFGLAKPIADQLGLTIWDVRFEKEGSVWMLSIILDKEGGITVDDCEAMSRPLDKKLDEVDPIEQSYCLEVSSAGIERELTKEWHFDHCRGEKVVVRLIRPINGEREYIGELLGYADGAVTIRTASKRDAAQRDDAQPELTFSQGDMAFIRLYAEF